MRCTSRYGDKTYDIFLFLFPELEAPRLWRRRVCHLGENLGIDFGAFLLLWKSSGIGHPCPLTTDQLTVLWREFHLRCRSHTPSRPLSPLSLRS
jgi:hypothetical protein